MKLRLYSDIHLDFDARRGYMSVNDVWAPPELPDDKDTILVLAGDIWRNDKATHIPPNSSKSWIATIADRFAHIVIVLGNHDYWGSATLTALRRMREGIQTLPNVHLLEKSSIVLAGVKFVGGTFWSNYDNGNPIVLYDVQRDINDFRWIKHGELRGVFRRLQSKDLIVDHLQCKQYIIENARRDHAQQPVIVVTHMAPDMRSIPLGYHTHLVHNYASDLASELSQCADIDIWMHGHIHEPCDYQSTAGFRVLSNPRGYAGHDKYHTYDNLGLQLDLTDTSLFPKLS
jgi:predicted MPP superfamily phosphohydrolase